MLNSTTPREIERKFFVRIPKKIENSISSNSILQTYLVSEDKCVERRIRLSRNIDSSIVTYFYTEKKDISFGERYEYEREIDNKEYHELLKERDISLSQISKTRYYLEYKCQVFELDIYEFDNIFGILEIELNDINTIIDFPLIEIVREVTRDKRYSNKSLAKTKMFPK